MPGAAGPCSRRLQWSRSPRLPVFLRHPPPPPPPTTTTTTQPPPSICGVTAAGAAATDAGAGDEHGGRDDNTTEYVAVVRRNGRSKVLTRQVQSPAELAQFRADAEAEGEVTAFEADGELQALTETPTWGFVDSGFTAAWGAAPVANGSGVRVAELDTGVDTTHPDLVGRFDGTGADIVGNAVTTKLDPPPVATTDPSTSGHGTHVAGILSATEGNNLGVAGGAPGITLVPVRVLGTSGAGSYSDVAEGLYWAADVTKGNAAVITMSLGGKSTSSVVTQAIADIENPANTNYTHPVITVAAGNSGCTTPLFPSSLANTTPQMLSVSALCKVGTTSTQLLEQAAVVGRPAVQAGELLVARVERHGIADWHRGTRHRDQLDVARWWIRPAERHLDGDAVRGRGRSTGAPALPGRHGRAGGEPPGEQRPRPRARRTRHPVRLRQARRSRRRRELLTRGTSPPRNAGGRR